jgi:flagellar biosynthetic protein FliO
MPKGMSTWWPLLAVLCMIGGAAAIFRRWLPKMQRMGQPGGIRVLSRFYLSGKQSLCLIRMGRRVVLLGVTPENIQTLVNVDDPEEAAHLITSLEQGRPGSFAKTFSGFMSSAGAARDDDAEPQEHLAVEKPLRRAATRITASVERLRKFMDKNPAEPA